MTKKGFTLIEALIAVAIFVTVSTLSAMMYVNNMRNYKYIKVEKELLDDVQFIVERITKEFQNSTIDYEEYYNKLVKEDDPDYVYGTYGARFYNGGVNTGQNPPLGTVPFGTFLESDWSKSCAFCDPYGKPGNLGCLLTSKDYWESTSLFMISGDGKEKTMFKFDDTSGNGKLLYLKMIGTDDDNNGIMESYANSSETPDFVPLSPTRTDIKKLKFYVSPLEDPYKAFAENNLTVQIQPHVTLYIEAEPSAENQGGLNKQTLPKVSVQTTVSSRVYHEVPSYLPGV